jgi:hypothetical protein
LEDQVRDDRARLRLELSEAQRATQAEARKALELEQRLVVIKESAASEREQVRSLDVDLSREREAKHAVGDIRSRPSKSLSSLPLFVGRVIFVGSSDVRWVV